MRRSDGKIIVSVCWSIHGSTWLFALLWTSCSFLYRIVDWLHPYQCNHLSVSQQIMGPYRVGSSTYDAVVSSPALHSNHSNHSHISPSFSSYHAVTGKLLINQFPCSFLDQSMIQLHNQLYIVKSINQSIPPFSVHSSFHSITQFTPHFDQYLVFSSWRCVNGQ